MWSNLHSRSTTVPPAYKHSTLHTPDIKAGLCKGTLTTSRCTFLFHNKTLKHERCVLRMPMTLLFHLTPTTHQAGRVFSHLKSPLTSDSSGPVSPSHLKTLKKDKEDKDSDDVLSHHCCPLVCCQMDRFLPPGLWERGRQTITLKRIFYTYSVTYKYFILR